MSEKKYIDEDINVIIEGEPYLSKAKEYRKEKNRILDIYRDFGRERGAVEINAYDHLTGLRFPVGKIPDGWSKPMASGFSFTNGKSKEGKKERKLLLSLPKLPSVNDVFGDLVDTDTLNWKFSEDDWGSRKIGKYVDSYAVGWIGETYIGRLIDPIAAVNNEMNRYTKLEKFHFDKKYFEWKLPSGLKKITKTELDFLTAEYKLKQEKGKNE